MFGRWLAPVLADRMQRPYVQILFGARQTGKSTLLKSLLPEDGFVVDLSEPLTRSRYMASPENLVNECRAMGPGDAPRVVFVDEAQSVPELFNAIQHLYDSDKTRWRFVLCGSSARKLRRTGVNLLPGRSMLHHLYPLILAERPPDAPRSKDALSPLPMPTHADSVKAPFFPPCDLATRLVFGELPGIAIADAGDRGDLLKAYAILHLEEEIRREALVKDWGAFVRFMQFAAAESGQILNYANIAQETGITIPTVKAYYQLLEDMFIGFRVPAFSRSPRKNLLSTPKFFFFDLGVRHAAAGLDVVPSMVDVNPGPFFEQWVGIELWKRMQYLGSGTLHHLRTRDGAEVDFIVEHGGKLTPIEVKWTSKPAQSDVRHVATFLKEHPRQADRGYLICRCPHPMQLTEGIVALPWSDL
jgi:uncharacterized protein